MANALNYYVGRSNHKIGLSSSLSSSHGGMRSCVTVFCFALSVSVSVISTFRLVVLFFTSTEFIFQVWTTAAQACRWEKFIRNLLIALFLVEDRKISHTRRNTQIKSSVTAGISICIPTQRARYRVAFCGDVNVAIQKCAKLGVVFGN